ncbi:hypothetical protein ABH924_003756 [Arthrobacter sp. GAS37]|uniref:hypothetical protein n=1 Tax=Arthrobacter sp. GAS37 TaxID=3156261 RepID=UPI0038375E72
MKASSSVRRIGVRAAIADVRVSCHTLGQETHREERVGMGWDLGDVDHDGWAGAVVPDGRLSSSSTGQGVLVEGITGRYERDGVMRGYEVVPDDEVEGWRGACTCGWLGPLWVRVTSASAADMSRRRAYAPLSGFAADPSVSVEDAIVGEWRGHVVPATAVSRVQAAASDYAAAGRRLTAAVAAARSAGVSWAGIGQATGMARQSAQERWKNAS